MRVVKYIGLSLITLVLWSIFMVYGVTNGFLLKSISGNSSPESFVNAVEEIVEKEFVGNLAMVLIENGTVAEQYYHSIDQELDEHTVY